MTGKPKQPRKLKATKAAQADILERLRQTDLSRAKYKGLAKCGARRCGMKRCRNVCAYGTERRLEQQGAAAHKLLKKVGGPYFEVHVGRHGWQKSIGNLDKVSLAAAKQVERNSLDKLHMPTIAAVGMVKAAFKSEEKDGGWHVEIHQIIAGVGREEIRTAFSTRLNSRRQNYFWIDKVKDLKQAVRRVLHQVVMVQQRPDDDDKLAWPNKQARREYYRWALRLRNGERVVRYGCDRHFKQIKKVGRTIRPKVSKPRRNPVWLSPYQFGTESREMRDLHKHISSQQRRECPPSD
jgi:hypothetical protein